ncbi:MAG: orotidine 5'-phosphate decarboxylase [Candidatus Altiarchaeota archaeon]|nr:orotidine 5'-phosphate decarboxylase [Candidatus Altiarchaeota archaeon]
MSFIKQYQRVRKEKDSIICVGLDPALPEQRRSGVIKKQYPGDEADIILQYCMETVDAVADNCCAIKINTQYALFALSYNKMDCLNQLIHSHGLISILDHKLGDIGSSNESAIYWIKKCGFDAFTFSPFAGNIRETVEAAHAKDLGVITLDLMSNPEAEGFQKKTRFNETPLFWRIAEDVKQAGGDGVVVGSTNHIRDVDISKIRKLIGDERLMLFPGVGAQGGDVKKILESAGESVLINIGRNIIYSDDPSSTSAEYNKRIRLK